MGFLFHIQTETTHMMSWLMANSEWKCKVIKYCIAPKSVTEMWVYFLKFCLPKGPVCRIKGDHLVEMEYNITYCICICFH